MPHGTTIAAAGAAPVRRGILRAELGATVKLALPMALTQLGQTAMLQFRQTRRDKVAVPTTIHCDHLIQVGVVRQQRRVPPLGQHVEARVRIPLPDNPDQGSCKQDVTDRAEPNHEDARREHDAHGTNVPLKC